MAAWLHDVGYAPSLAQTGFHRVDGARFLRARGVPEVVVALVAHHTGAVFEAEQRGLDVELLAEFALPPVELLDPEPRPEGSLPRVSASRDQSILDPAGRRQQQWRRGDHGSVNGRVLLVARQNLSNAVRRHRRSAVRRGHQVRVRHSVLSQAQSEGIAVGDGRPRRSCGGVHLNSNSCGHTLSPDPRLVCVFGVP